MTSFARRAFVILAAISAWAIACNSPPAATANGSSGAPSASAVPAATGSAVTAAPGAAPAPGPSSAPGSSSATPSLPKRACTADADCRLASSYCADAPCACLVLGKGDVEPKCSGAQVRCFADPCMKKGARCDAGKCVLSTAGATDR
ncbi:MAG: hypothetical protein JST00_41925 [Deltaproteobacteria bacterium]|nr:hypothetical protein [Deltaproteobacteria bacterium]